MFYKGVLRNFLNDNKIIRMVQVVSGKDFVMVETDNETLKVYLDIYNSGNMDIYNPKMEKYYDKKVKEVFFNNGEFKIKL